MPSTECMTIVNFVIHARCQFMMKRDPDFTRSPHHIVEMISLMKSHTICRKQPRICFKVISYNSYVLHAENLLQSTTMLGGPRPEVRLEAVRRIVISRNNEEIIVRKFIKPRINYEETHYVELLFMLNFNEATVLQ